MATRGRSPGTVQQLRQHRPSEDKIVGPHTINREESGVWVHVCERSHSVTHAIHSCPRGQCELEWCTRCFDRLSKFLREGFWPPIYELKCPWRFPLHLSRALSTSPESNNESRSEVTWHGQNRLQRGPKVEGSLDHRDKPSTFRSCTHQVQALNLMVHCGGTLRISSDQDAMVTLARIASLLVGSLSTEPVVAGSEAPLTFPLSWGPEETQSVLGELGKPAPFELDPVQRPFVGLQSTLLASLRNCSPFWTMSTSCRRQQGLDFCRICLERS